MTIQQQHSLQPIAPADSAPKILLVKLSSLGDVLHNLPIVWDLRKRLPEAQIDWIVEEAYVPLLEPRRVQFRIHGQQELVV
jgi:heptosyltransferase-1